jgi:hypothetical protein
MTNANQPGRSQDRSGVSRLLALLWRRNIVSDVVQGIIAGGVLAFFTAILVINVEDHAIQTTVNGWSTTLKCGKPGNGILLRAACANGVAALNLPEEEVYWTTFVDGASHKLNGQHDYILHFPPGGLPPMMPPGH